jgi:hypothetical protein
MQAYNLSSGSGQSVFDICNKPSAGNPLDAHGLQGCVRSIGMSMSKAEAGELVGSAAQRKVEFGADTFVLKLSHRAPPPLTPTPLPRRDFRAARPFTAAAQTFPSGGFLRAAVA